ncbi:MAG: PAS domain-containing protein [Xanthobacteraceae bacterium]
MKNKASQELFSYWNAQRGLRRAPARNDINPGALRSVLGDTFMLTREAGVEPTFRLAGTRICDMFGRELKGTTFLTLWDARSHRELQEILEHLSEETAGVVAGVIGQADDEAPLPLEMLLLPLYGAGATEARSIGTLAPASPAGRLDLQSVSGLSLQGWRVVGPQVEDVMVPRYVDTPAVARPGLVVHSGGRT